MTEQVRKLAIKERSCGLQSPPEEFQPHNHKGLGIGLISAHGNSAKTFVAPINAPPKISEISVVTTLWNT
tara:strand:- start:317 stop:526 length:210 start_codon:yes stop_codon:yes gene_type:complete